jgi:uncharacterized protein YdeI (YjbR/CyaY-like superfamily)
MSSMIRQLYVADRQQWRNWLSKNHAAEAGIWLIFYKKETSRPTIAYEDAVEEALLRRRKKQAFGTKILEIDYRLISRRNLPRRWLATKKQKRISISLLQRIESIISPGSPLRKGRKQKSGESKNQ